MNDTERTLCVATANLLRASRVAAAWGLGLSCVSVLVLALTGRSLPAASWAAFAAVALIGLLERLAAFKLRNETGLLEALVQGSASLADYDEALETMGLKRPGQPSKPLPERLRAARQLMQRHGLAVAVQTIAFALALALE